MLLGGQAGERIEHVRIVSGSLEQRPLLHRRGHDVGDLWVQEVAGFNRPFERLVDILRETGLHRRWTEDVRAEERLDRMFDVIRCRRRGQMAVR
jgi:hypothetical protein